MTFEKPEAEGLPVRDIRRATRGPKATTSRRETPEVTDGLNGSVRPRGHLRIDDLRCCPPECHDAPAVAVARASSGPGCPAPGADGADRRAGHRAEPAAGHLRRVLAACR